MLNNQGNKMVTKDNMSFRSFDIRNKLSLSISILCPYIVPAVTNFIYQFSPCCLLIGATVSVIPNGCKALKSVSRIHLVIFKSRDKVLLYSTYSLQLSLGKSFSLQTSSICPMNLTLSSISSWSSCVNASRLL